ncbi:hypothetical protein [Methanosarcina barkeri]|uniref:Gingipain domain-containing protein n=1 Tax=Methanosarcina barkeri CM1 TaxID=796385 RepID=A0A0G3CFC3_METBA|nr:hypothetical protein [Methanosarcina barkeri]AKJ38638.1 hypothetical protein MCM1_1600 [Methanosarcina barkeri CM1]
MDERDGGFIFAGACKSAKYTDLGNAFINNGFDTYFGYEDNVNTLHNALFYSAFFDAATFTDALFLKQPTMQETKSKKSLEMQQMLPITDL